LRGPTPPLPRPPLGSPEDLRHGIINAKPAGAVQLAPFEPTDRLRRIMAHDVENNVPFLAVGLLYVVAGAGGPGPLYAYAAFKAAHHAVYLAGAAHEFRAAAFQAHSFAFAVVVARVLAVL